MGFGIALRVWGEYALFTRPEMKVERVSYDMITPSAARGIIEAVYWKPAMRWVIDKIHVMKEISFTNIRRNEVGEKISKSVPEKILNGDTSQYYLSATVERQQRAALVLRNVEYILEAHFETLPQAAQAGETPEKHYNMIVRRLQKGQHYHAPCLGTREFPAHLEWVEKNAIPSSPLKGSLDLGWMLYDLDYSDQRNITPRFFRALLHDGVLDLNTVLVREG